MKSSKLAQSIFIFRELLNAMWEEMSNLIGEVDDNYLLDDWKQANWELIVEGSTDTFIFLQPYGSGADYYGDSSRILRPESLPTHEVHCFCSQPLKDRLTGKLISLPDTGFPFELFVTMRDGWYYEEPPFDCLLVINNKEEIVIGLDEVGFALTCLSDLKNNTIG